MGRLRSLSESRKEEMSREGGDCRLGEGNAWMGRMTRVVRLYVLMSVTVLLSLMVELRRQGVIKSWFLCRSFPGVGWLL